MKLFENIISCEKLEKSKTFPLFCNYYNFITLIIYYSRQKTYQITRENQIVSLYKSYYDIPYFF